MEEEAKWVGLISHWRRLRTFRRSLRFRARNPHSFAGLDYGLLKKNNREFVGLRNLRKSCGGRLSSGRRPVEGDFRVGCGEFWGIGLVMEKGRTKPPVPGACAGRPNTGGWPPFLGSDIKKNKRFVGGWTQYPFGTADQAGNVPPCD
jgi:hypothetical protein